MDIELLVNVGSKQYGGRGFYTYEEFRDATLEELARIGREGKGMFTTYLKRSSWNNDSRIKSIGNRASKSQQNNNNYGKNSKSSRNLRIKVKTKVGNNNEMSDRLKYNICEICGSQATAGINEIPKTK